MIPLPLAGCEGLDTRQAWTPDSFKLETCDNIQILPAGSIASRPALVEVAGLHAQSVGLYSRGGYLRCIVPSGQSYQDLAPYGSGVIYDGIGQGGSFNYDNKIAQVLVAETFGTSVSSGPNGYVSILRSDNGLVEHHWIREPPASAATYTDTKVNLPFTPGKALLKIETKLVADDPANGYLRYCSSLSASDWLAVSDAGFEAALQFVNGSREIVGLGVHRGAMAVLFSDAVQLWHMDAVPANIQPLETMNGPGTVHPRSIENIGGDLICFGPAGFSSLTTARDTGLADHGDIGEEIRSLTEEITGTDAVIALFSQRRSQYLAAYGTTVYVLNRYRGQSDPSWVKWTLPVEVEAMAELNGVVYIRSGDTLYRLDDTVGRDSGASSDIAWSWQSISLGGPARSQVLIKSLKEIVVQNTARATWTPVCDGRTLTGARVIIPGSTRPIRANFCGSGRRVGVLCQGAGLMRMDGLLMSAEECGV